MGRFVLDASALDAFAHSPEATGLLEQLGQTILEESNADMAEMGAVATGAMRDSGDVEAEAGTVRIGYHVIYAPIVHEGTGLGRNSAPRPFLAKAATRDRGRIG